MARIRKADERLDAEFSHEADDPAWDFICPHCEDTYLLATDDTLVFRCSVCGYCEMGKDRI